jgi:hypothetical protein
MERTRLVFRKQFRVLVVDMWARHLLEVEPSHASDEDSTASAGKADGELFLPANLDAHQREGAADFTPNDLPGDHATF